MAYTLDNVPGKTLPPLAPLLSLSVPMNTLTCSVYSASDSAVWWSNVASRRSGGEMRFNIIIMMAVLVQPAKPRDEVLSEAVLTRFRCAVPGAFCVHKTRRCSYQTIPTSLSHAPPTEKQYRHHFQGHKSVMREQTHCAQKTIDVKVRSAGCSYGDTDSDAAPCADHCLLLSFTLINAAWCLTLMVANTCTRHTGSIWIHAGLEILQGSW